MGFWAFVRKNVGPSWLGGVGALIGVWGFLADAQSLWTAGIKPGYLQLSGFVLFVLATISVLHRQHQMLEQRLAEAAPLPLAKRRLPQSPVSAPKLAASVRTVTPIAVPVKADRGYLPASFAKEFIALKSRTHTRVQVDSLLEPHIGQWVRLKLCLADVSRSGETVNVIVRAKKTATDHFTIRFPRRWESQLTRMNADQMFDVDAQIGQTDSGPRLENCELL
jgi:hypothetical protein